MECVEESTSKIECRLCLETLIEFKWSIQQPDLREKLHQIFRFTIDIQSGFSSHICNACLTIIEDFHQYTERVQSNQEILAARLKFPIAQQNTIKFEAQELDIKHDEYDNDKYDDTVDNVGNDWIDEVQTFAVLEVKGEPHAKRSSRSQRKATLNNTEAKQETKQRRTNTRRSGSKLKVEQEDEQIESADCLSKSSAGDDDSMEDEEDYQPEQKKQRKTTARRCKSGQNLENGEQNASKKLKKQTKKPDQSVRDEWQEDIMRIEQFYDMVCDLCGDTLDDLLSLRKHFRSEHGMAAYIKCCNKKLMRRGTMVDHIVVHANPETYRCDICDKTFKGKRYITEHLENVHGSIEKRPYKCEQCDRYFAKESLLRTHISNHRKVHCSQCNKEFPNTRFLKEHLKTVHDNAHLTRVCDRCGKSFSGPSARSGLKQHIDGVHMGLGDKTKRQCSICQKWLLGKRCLTVHMQLHSEMGQPHICNICNQNYPHSRALTRHKRFVHGEQKYECEFCGKKFRKSVALKEHRATHTGEALYTCKICGSTTNSNASYYSHMKKQHPIEWAEQKLKAEEANRPTTEQTTI
ncbi:transcription factor grauzone-like [Armigeres subalbatus]|uniref:transcription factor grauzone-like n=1 Tax=Armigeres subalbatus TaxID=124917 RepID=UPI002ED42393